MEIVGRPVFEVAVVMDTVAREARESIAKQVVAREAVAKRRWSCI